MAKAFGNLLIEEEFWLDEDTYVVVFQDQMDEDGDMYHLEAEYHKDEDRVTFVRVYDYEVDDENLDEDVRKEIEEYVLSQKEKKLD